MAKPMNKNRIEGVAKQSEGLYGYVNFSYNKAYINSGGQKVRKLLVRVLDVLLWISTVIIVLVSGYVYGLVGLGASLIFCALFGGLWCVLSLIYENTTKANEISQKHLDLLELLQNDMEQSLVNQLQAPPSVIRVRS